MKICGRDFGRYLSALKRLAKANGDLSKTTQSVLDRKFDVYGETSRVQESIRQLLEVDKDFTPKDKNE